MPFPATNPALSRALAARGYVEPTPVQEAVLQPEADGRDLLVSAQTGSGKTVAYGLAFAPTLLGDAQRFPQPATPMALVIAPTRELAMQVHRELSWLYEQTDARIVSCIGGMDPRAEAKALQSGCHIVIGTPGRLCDHMQRGRLDLSQLRVFVMDEADEMLDLGFREELEMLLAASPTERRTLLFSATIAKDIAVLAKQYQRDALRIDTLNKGEAHADIEYRVVRVAPLDVEHAVVNVLRYFEAPTALVFCSTRDQVRHLYGSLLERGFTAVALSGELNQNERTRALQAMRDGQARVCVATDVAARGIDLPDLGLVIHASLPTNSATLLHRSGRTGRAGRKGVCVVITPSNRFRRAEQLLYAAGVEANWSGPPDADRIRAKDGERLLADPILSGDAVPEDADLVAKLLEGRSPQDLAAALIRMHRARLPAAEEMAPEKAERNPDRRPMPMERERGGDRDRGPRPDRPGYGEGDARPHAMGNSGVWFTMNVGRRNKADPKWLIPLICRMGNVKKPDIGNIKIFDGETKFEISSASVDRFMAALPADGTDEVRIARDQGAPQMSYRPKYQPRPAGESRRSDEHRSPKKKAGKKR
jgi:ATP-dependent RNA helicase DeaD